MIDFARLQDRIARLPQAKATEYATQLHLLMGRSSTDPLMIRFVERLARAEFLTGSVRHGPATRQRVTP